MSKTFLLVESVNIYKSVYDTDQLSVIRGTSFMLKNAITAITDKFAEPLTNISSEDDNSLKQLQAISTGASSGLYEVINGFSGIKAAEDVIDFLRDEIFQFHLLPILVEYCEADNLIEAKQRLFAQLRFSQLQSVTVVPDYVDALQNVSGVCQLEGVRCLSSHPEQRKVQGDISKKLSDSVFKRLEYGRDARNSYYARELEELSEKTSDYAFTNDIEALATGTGDFPLNHKVAVVYMDGNGFGSLQQDIIGKQTDYQSQIDAQRQFDTRLQTLRKQLLESILKEIHQTPSRFPVMFTVNKEIRFETLLWGGDEMLFVMPAWIGFEFIQFVFEKTANWEIDGIPLTHATGIVFCHSKTPIRIIRDVAQTMLADQIKESRHDEVEGRSLNAFDYLVLESIDYPANQDIADYTSRRYGVAAQYRPAWLVPNLQWTTIKMELEKIVHGKLLGKRQLYIIADALRTLDVRTESGEKALNTLEQRLLSVAEDTPALEDALDQVYLLFAHNTTSRTKAKPTERAWMWLHLLELWDYLLPVTKPQALEHP